MGITNEQREAIVRKALAERDALLNSTGQYASEAEAEDGRSRILALRESAKAYRLLANLARLRKLYDDANPPLEEQGERVFKEWAYKMSDAWDEAYAYLGLPTFSRKFPAETA